MKKKILISGLVVIALITTISLNKLQSNKFKLVGIALAQAPGHDYDPENEDSHGIGENVEACVLGSWLDIDTGETTTTWGTRVWCSVDTFFGSCDAHPCE